jgi:O-antigen/teichoic acid export membrane protein
MALRADALPGVGLRRGPSPLARARARLQIPLYRNGYALVASSGLTSGLGLVYWLVAARAYSVTAVGVSAALISAMTLLANLCQLNLKSGLNRFLPRAGTTTARLVTRSYLLALGVSGVASLVFVAGLGIWSPRLQFLQQRPELVLWFVAATMVWTIFVLQDSVLAGIRRAAWVPLENVVYAVVKIVLLFALAAAAPTLGTFVAWTAPLLLLVVPVNLLLFRWLIPAHVRGTEDRQQPVAPWRLARYVAADYAAYLIITATVGVLPLVVLAVLGPASNAYYYVSWSIAYGLYLISSGMGVSMITEASLDPARLVGYRRQSTLETARLMVPAVALVVVAAPLILDLLGDGYSREGVTLLRLMALSALPWIVFVSYTNAARVERRMKAVVGAHAALCGLVLAIGLPLLGPLGIDGIGVGWLAAQSAVAAAIVAGRLARRSHRDWEEDAFRALSSAAAWIRMWWRRLTSAGALREVLAELRRRPGRSGWVVQRHLSTVNDVAASAVGRPGAEPAALVKRSASESGDRALGLHARALSTLPRLAGLAGWARMVPRLLASGRAGGRAYVVETRVPGTPCERLLRNGLGGERPLAAAAAAIGQLHQATGATTTVDEGLLSELVDIPLARLGPAVAGSSGLARAETALGRLRGELRGVLKGRRVITARVHGDLCPGNILMTPDGAAVRGIVDWEQTRERGLPQLDLLQLLMTARMTAQRREMGDVVAEMLRNPGWQAPERPLAGAIRRLDPDLAADTRPLVLLAWLHHLAANLGKSTRYGHSRVWIRRNVDPVLRIVLRQPVPVPATAPGPAALPEPWRAPRRRGLGERLADVRAAIGAARLEAAAALGALCLAVFLWLVSLDGIDPRAMTDLGLVSVLPLTFVLALLALTASFAVLVRRRPERNSLLAAHLLALIAFLHATPTIVYGTLRYSWAWKHVGIVDYLQRHGGVAPRIEYLSVYHNWPGFFGLDTLLTELAGLHDTLQLAVWGPVFVNVLNLGALVFLFSGLTRDRRVVWLGSWLFFIANWVGQDYFSPQAFAFLLYLVVLGVVVRWLGQRSADDGPGRRGALAFAVLLVATIAPSHALTGVMVSVALTVLVLAGVCRARILPFVAVAITALWDLVFAADFVGRNAGSTLEQVRLPWMTTESSLAQVGELSSGQALVAGVARGLVVAVVALAAVGAVRAMRAGQLNRAAAVLAAAPLLLFASGDYDGEILFRVYLFAVPFLAFLGAQAFIGQSDARRRSWTPPAASAVAGTLLLGAFLVAYYGKEHQNYFTPSEVAASRYVYTHGPPGSLLVEGTHNYPAQFKNYERFRYVTIAREPAASRARLLARPAAVLTDWMSDSALSAAYLIITRSQKVEVDELGSLPRGSLDRIERALLASPHFRVVFRNRDATVFSLAKVRG